MAGAISAFALNETVNIAAASSVNPVAKAARGYLKCSLVLLSVFHLVWISSNASLGGITDSRCHSRLKGDKALFVPKRIVLMTSCLPDSRSVGPKIKIASHPLKV